MTGPSESPMWMWTGIFRVVADKDDDDIQFLDNLHWFVSSFGFTWLLSEEMVRLAINLSVHRRLERRLIDFLASCA